jgi:uncharacterized membrane protein YvlD (DUF360 family)
MKKLFRMLFFSGAAIFLTALWNKGFVISEDPATYIKAAVVITIVYYLVAPISKLILLPLNILTLGLVSVVFYSLLFYFLLNHFNLISIREWTMTGVKILGISMGNIKISGLANIFVSSFSISTIINLFEKII